MKTGFRAWFVGVLGDESGGTAIEYALIAGGIFLAIVGAVSIYVDRVGNMYNNVANNL